MTAFWREPERCWVLAAGLYLSITSLLPLLVQAGE